MNSQATPKTGAKLPTTRLSTRRTYKNVLERAGVIGKKSGGCLDEWIPKLRDNTNDNLMEENLGLPQGSITVKKKKRSGTWVQQELVDSR